jgi:pimeloyl-ACP methyl ester carboxylesterase
VECAALFGGDRDLVGVVTPTRPDRPTSRTAALFLNAGLIHRVGAHRLNVRLARTLADHGVCSLRFDLSGVGDSRPAPDPRPLIQRWVAEIRMAMDFLHESEGAERFIVAGSCSGAVGAYLAAQADPRVAGVALINPPHRGFRPATGSVSPSPSPTPGVACCEAPGRGSSGELLRNRRVGGPPVGPRFPPMPKRSRGWPDLPEAARKC